MKENETYLTFVQKLDGDLELHRNHSGFFFKKEGKVLEIEISSKIGGEKILISQFTHLEKIGLYYQLHATQVGVIALNQELKQEFLEERGGGVNFPWSPPGTFPGDREILRT